jgi:hypothetical protein
MSKDKNYEDIAKINKKADNQIKQIFKDNGLVTYRRIGLRRQLVDFVVKSTIKGEIEEK